MEFYKELISARKSKNLSQEELASEMNVSRQAVSKWENGTAQPELSNIIKLCDILEITPNELFGYPASSEYKKAPEDKKTKKIRTVFIAAVIIIAAVLNIFIIKALIPEPEKEYIINEFNAFGFSSEIISDTGYALNIKITFSPSVSGSECVFSVTSAYGDKIYSSPAVYENGICTASVSVPYYTDVHLTACMEQNGFTYTDSLAIIAEADKNGYTSYSTE